MTLLFLALGAVALTVSLAVETLGIHARLRGALAGRPTSGYSSHVRMATAARAFILLAAPAFGLAVDRALPAAAIARAGAGAFALLFCVLAFSEIHNRRTRAAPSQDPRRPGQAADAESGWDRSFWVLCLISFSFTAIGVVAVNVLSALFPAFRATLVQMSGFVTGLGTLIHVFFIDPKLAHWADTDTRRLARAISIYISARTHGSLLIASILGAVSIFIPADQL